MMYHAESIAKLSLEIEKYEIYESFGHGVMESPYSEGKVVKELECSRMDAWIISEAMNIEKWGIISKRSGWEEPTYSYRRVL